MTITRVDAVATLPGELFSRVALTASAVELLRQLWVKHGALMFHQSGGCCDGSSPMCYQAGDFLTGEADVLLGRFDIAPRDESGSGSELDLQFVNFWMSKEQFSYWSHTHLTVDVVAGRGSGFSVESPEGKRFLIRSRLMDWPA
ncbi:DUF779 domain-containing protein [Paenarthrobacter nicotinovorans]|uniref:DUF779 domain-containing protein n=1 Tax=Paenarthrobacter nicotinovorans TaxID=29320 RepID=UPI003A7FCF61